MSEQLPESARRVQEALEARGLALRVVTFPAGTRTAQDAAAAVGCAVGQIAKSLVFRGASSGRPLLVVASGANRVSEAKLAALAGEPIGKADAAFVRAATGYAIGGVPPVGHPSPIETILDADLWQHGQIWAAAGTPSTVFALSPDDLARLTGGRVAEVRE